eukprot:855779-Rhodomonas_salina.1
MAAPDMALGQNRTRHRRPVGTPQHTLRHYRTWHRRPVGRYLSGKIEQDFAFVKHSQRRKLEPAIAPYPSSVPDMV